MYALAKSGKMAENSAPVLAAEIGRRAHAGDEDRQPGGLGLVEDRRKRCLGRRGLEAAQHVVGPEFDDQRVGVRRHGPVIAREPVRSRIAGHACIEDLDIPAPGAERCLQAIRKGLAGWQAESGGQAVSEDHEAKRPRRGGRSRDESRSEGDRLDEANPMPI